MREGHGAVPQPLGQARSARCVTGRMRSQMLVIGGDRRRDRDSGRARDPVVPARTRPSRRTTSDALRRAADRLGAGLRAGRDGRPVLGLEVPDAPGRGGQGRAADPRQHPARGGLDGGAGDPDRRRCAPTPTRCCARTRTARRTRSRSTSPSGSSRSSSPTRRPAARRSSRRSCTSPRASRYVFKLRSLDVIHSFFVPDFSESSSTRCPGSRRRCA